MLKKRHLLMWIGFALFMTLSVAWAEDYPKMKLRCSNFVPETLPASKVDIFVADEVNRRTNGHIKVDIFHGQTLGKATEVIDLVGGGAVDIGNIALGYVFALWTWQVWFLAAQSWTIRETATGLLSYPLYPVKFLLFLGLLIAMLESLRQLFGSLNKIFYSDKQTY